MVDKRIQYTETQQLVIANQRLKKRIVKLTKQRDHYKEQLNHYKQVISMQPYIESRYKTFEERRRREAEQKMIAERVEEQAKLIKLLTSQVEQKA